MSAQGTPVLYLAAGVYADLLCLHNNVRYTTIRTQVLLLLIWAACKDLNMHGSFSKHAQNCTRLFIGYGWLQLVHTAVNQLEFTLGSLNHPKPYKMTVVLHPF
jgi:hypothetical protein